MLGRLLRTSSMTDFMAFGGGSNGSAGTSGEEAFQNEPCYMTDDFKTLLFGTRDRMLFDRSASDRLHSGGFRLILAQELGHLSSRNNYQVVLDHGSPSFHGTSHIPLNELKDYIFGSPIRTVDYSASSDKIKVVKNANIVLFTRIFYLDEKSTLRFAISCCISDDFLPVLTELWPRVSQYLDQCEHTLVNFMVKNSTHFLPKDWKSRDCVEVGCVLQTFQRKVIPLLCGYADTPRLFLYPMNSIPYIKTWVKYVTNWIELKDGPRMRFLPVLLAKLRYDFASILKDQTNARVVVLTGNMNVANRLIFILTAFIGPHFQGTLHKSATPQMFALSAANNSSHINYSSNINNNKKVTNFSKFSDSPFELKSSSSSITETSKGWEIPRTKRNPTLGVTSVSSDETGVQSFIQPSSLKSGASSVHYLSSSLNSTYGSYGSWFKKVAQSPSSSQETTSILRHNGSSTSLHQQAILSNANVSQRATPQPSPTVTEYDEYPWIGGSPITRDSPRFEKRTSISAIHGVTDRKALLQHEIYEVDMKRTLNRLIDEEDLNEAFASLVLDPPKFSTAQPDENKNHGEIVEVDAILPNKMLSQFDTPHKELLPRYTAYTPAYNQYFQLQACQITPESENKIIHSMKRDLSSIDQNSNSTSTLLISLRSREIKQITIIKDVNNRFIQKTKRIFQNGKIGPVSKAMVLAIEKTEAQLKGLMENIEDNVELQSQFNDIVECLQPS